MGDNSTDALDAFMKQYMAKCVVIGNRIVTPGEPGYYDPLAGGHKLADDPKFNGETDQGTGSARDQ